VTDCFKQGVGAADLFRRAEQLEKQRQHKEAAGLLKELVDHSPSYPAYVGLGTNLALSGDATRAEQAFRDALRLDPDGALAHHLLGKVLWARADRTRRDGGDATALFEEAADHARRATARMPDHAPAHLLLGQAMEGLGERAKAVAAYRAAVACSPDAVDGYLLLGEALAADDHREEARAALEEAVRRAKADDPRPRAALARLGPAS
jgi:tetratricopeptide (TPR) repeat protein